MRISTMRRHFREAFRSVWRNGWMSFASISAIAISLFILGVFVILALNVNKLMADVEKEVEIRVYLDLNFDRSETSRLQNAIGSLEGVKRTEFISKEEGMENLKESLGEEGKALLEGQEGDNNPLPDVFVVEVYEPRMIGVVADRILALNDEWESEPIWEVNYGADTVRTLFQVTNIVRNVGFVIVLGLAVTSMFLIANTIKTTIVARRREIAIMKLVGATNGFIRWPFFLEGAILGLIGSVIPAAVLVIGYDQLVSHTAVELGLLQIVLVPTEEVTSKVLGLLIGFGLLIGIWGSTLSVRKFLKV